MDTQKGFLRVHFLFGVEARMNLTSFLQDKRLMIALKGDIDHHGAKDVMRVLGNKIDLYLPAVCVLDFRDVTFMDSSGIAIIISCIRRRRELRGEVIVENVPPQPMKVLRASGLEQIVKIEERGLVYES